MLRLDTLLRGVRVTVRVRVRVRVAISFLRIRGLFFLQTGFRISVISELQNVNLTS